MVMILLAPGFEEAEALVPADLLRRAGVEVQLVGVGGSCITGSHGITVAADLALEQADTQTLEMLVLPGGLGGVRAIVSHGVGMSRVCLRVGVPPQVHLIRFVA